MANVTVERAFLDAITGYLETPGILSPVPKLLGIAEPATNQDLPAVVLSLSAMRRPPSGLGHRSLLVEGALPWTARIDLANPVLPGNPPLNLLSADRKTLILPHGGLVHPDGTSGSATPASIQVTVEGQSRTLVAANPQAGEFQADPLSGTLVFGAALPAQGSVETNYFIGQWERQTARLEGELVAVVAGDDVNSVRDVSDSFLAAALDAPEQIAGLGEMSLAELGAVAAMANGAVAKRTRQMRFRFEYEFELNLPESSGGIIREVPVTANLG